MDGLPAKTISTLLIGAKQHSVLQTKYNMLGLHDAMQKYSAYRVPEESITDTNTR